MPSMSYYPVPASILEDADALVVWAREAVDVAGRGRERRQPAKRALSPGEPPAAAGLASSTSRTFRSSVVPVYGLARNWTRSSREAVARERVVGVARRVEDAACVRLRRAARPTSVGPLMPGITTSVSSRWTGATARRKCVSASSPFDGRPGRCSRRSRGSCARPAAAPARPRRRGSSRCRGPPSGAARCAARRAGVGRRSAGRPRRSCPAPRSERRRMAPPLWRTMPNTVDRPRPVPLPGALVVKNGSKTRLRVASSMPSPVSVTESTHVAARPDRRSLGRHHRADDLGGPRLDRQHAAAAASRRGR